MGAPPQKTVTGVFLRLLPMLFGLLIVLYFILPVFTQQRIVGPFDFLVNFYHPYKDLPWEKTPELYAQYTKPKNYLMSDVVGVVFPMKYYSIESLKQGVIPLWNPAILNGAPHLANTQSSVFNPFNIVFVLLGYMQGFNAFIILQLILAYAGMYLFLRQLKTGAMLGALGALSFAFSGYMIVWLPWGTIGYAYATLPWALYLLKKRYWLSILPLVVSLYSGHIQTTLIVTVFFYAYALYLKVGIRKIFTHALLFLLLSAPQILPTLQLFKYSGRTLVSGADFYEGQSLPLQHLVSVIAPDFFGNPVTRNWWGHNNYAETVSFAGTLIALLGIVSVWHTIRSIIRKQTIGEIVFFVSAGLVSILLSVQSPLLFLLYKLNIPVFSTSTFSRNLSVLAFSGIVGGILLLSDLRKQKIPKKVVIAGVLTALVILAITWLFVLIVLPGSSTAEVVVTAKRNLLLPTALVIVYSVLFLFAGLKLSKKIVIVSVLLMFCFQTVDLLRFAQKYTPFSPKEFFYPETALGKFIGTSLQHKTYLNLIDANHANIIHGESLGGSDPLFLKEYAELATSSKKGSPSITDRTGVPVERGPYFTRIINVLGAQYLADKNRYFQNFWQDENPGKIFENEFPKVWADEIYQVFFNKYAADSFYTIPTDRVIQKSTGQSVISAVLDPKFDPRKDAVISDDEQLIVPTSSADSNKITSMDIKTQRQIVGVASSRSAILVNNQTYYPNWTVTVDGKKARLLKVNHVLQGVQISAGTHKVEFIYEDRVFMVGCLLWILGIIFLARRIVNISTPAKIIRSFRRTLS